MKKIGNPASETKLLDKVGGVKLQAPLVLKPDQIQQIAAGTMSFSEGKLSTTLRVGFWERPSLQPAILGAAFK